jgi:hypothetical protein
MLLTVPGTRWESNSNMGAKIGELEKEPEKKKKKRKETI